MSNIEGTQKMARAPGELSHVLREAVVEWRDARTHLSQLTYTFDRKKDGTGVVVEDPEILEAWQRLAFAENALMDIARELV
jgi:hypothetical protein